jgi:hypothetical protein
MRQPARNSLSMPSQSASIRQAGESRTMGGGGETEIAPNEQTDHFKSPKRTEGKGPPPTRGLSLMVGLARFELATWSRRSWRGFYVYPPTTYLLSRAEQMVQKLRDCAESFPATRATGHGDAFAALGSAWLLIHERRQVVTPDFLL